MLTWISTHPAAAMAVAVLVVFDASCVVFLMEWRRESQADEVDTSQESGAPEGLIYRRMTNGECFIGSEPTPENKPVTVRMPRFR